MELAYSLLRVEMSTWASSMKKRDRGMAIMCGLTRGGSRVGGLTINSMDLAYITPQKMNHPSMDFGKWVRELSGSVNWK